MNQQMHTQDELQSMTREEFNAARERGFVKPSQPSSPQVEQRTGEAIFGEGYTGSATAEAKYAPVVWGQNEYDFVCPSGQTCRMRKLRPEALVESGLLDRLTRLPGFVELSIREAEGKPPIKEMPTSDQMSMLTEVVNELIPLVVVKPHVNPDPVADETGAVKGKTPGFIYVSDIELADRIAIMERAVQGVAKMDNFRKES